MDKNKTLATKKSVSGYISTIQNEKRRNDAAALLQIMKDVTGIDPVLWGIGIIGFGNRHYVYETGREGDTFKVGFAARTQALVLYGLVFYELQKENNELLGKLGSHAAGKGCLYIKSLADVDTSVLKQMIENSFHTK